MPDIVYEVRCKPPKLHEQSEVREGGLEIPTFAQWILSPVRISKFSHLQLQAFPECGKIPFLLRSRRERSIIGRDLLLIPTRFSRW